MKKFLNLFNSKCSSITFTHEWTIANFSRLYHENYPWKWEIFPETFSPLNNEQFECKVYFRPKSNVEDKKNYVSIGFGVYKMPQMYEGKIKSQWNVSIVDDDGERCKTFDSGVYTLINNEGKYVSNYLKYSDILNCASQYLPHDKLTLHFEIHLQANDGIFNVITNNEVGRSRFDSIQKVTTVEQTWTIENFSELFGKDTVAPHFIQSQLDKPNERFSLRLYPFGPHAESSDNVEIHICNDCETSVTIHGGMSILDVDGDQRQSKEGTRMISSNSGMVFQYNRASLLKSSNELLHNGKFQIFCEMSYMTKPTDSELEKNALPLDSVHKSESVFNVKQTEVHYLEHQWTIDKFRAQFLNSQKNHSIESQIFEAPTDTRIKFKLLLNLNSYDQHGEKCFSLDICNLSDDQVTAQSRLSILTANGDRMRVNGGQSTIPQYGGIQTTNFIPLSVLQNASLAKQFLPDDKLTIICEVYLLCTNLQIVFTEDNETNQCDINTKSTTNPNTQSRDNNPSVQGITININNSSGVVINILSSNSMNDFKVNES